MPQDRRRPRLRAAALLIAVALVPSAPPLPPLAAASSASSSPGKGKRKEKSLAGVLFPGASPESYPLGEPLPVWVEPVQSDRTRVPFGYYDLPGIGNCAAAKSTEGGDSRPPRKSLGSRLAGGHGALPAPYGLVAGRDLPCATVCATELGGKDLKWMRRLVGRQYRVHLLLDQLPVLMRHGELSYAVRGVPLGFRAPPSFTGGTEDEYFLYNHLRFEVGYRDDPDEAGSVRIVSFAAHPVSFGHGGGAGPPGRYRDGDDVATCSPEAPPVANDPGTYLALRAGPGGEPVRAVYSYEVRWKRSDIPWADRWDVYLSGSPDRHLHYFSIVNSLMIVIFLTGAVATIMIRTLRNDISGYNEMAGRGGGGTAGLLLEDGGAGGGGAVAGREEGGWKLVHGDVWRPPRRSPMALSVAVGTGAQLFATAFLVLACAVLGLVNPMQKGQALTAVVLLYVLSGAVSGYVSSRIYKLTGGREWRGNAALTAAAFPGLAVGMFMVLNVFLGIAGAATHASFVTILLVFLLWVGLSTPLVLGGSYLGFRSGAIELPTKTNQIARLVPDRPTMAREPWNALVAGLLPFGSVCIELFFIMSALWADQYFYMMGLLMVVLLILVATCSTVSVVFCYLQLCAEDHRWWWKSFRNTATAGLYLFLYSLWFLGRQLDLVGVLPVVVYLTYMSMISAAFSLLCGAVGFLTCLWFTRRIYGAVKID